MILTEQLKEYADNSAQKIPAEAQVIMKNAIDALQNSTIIDNALKTGDTIPEIALPNAKGNIVNIQNILNEGKKIVLAFYRGGWCPYCNIELRALQANLSEFEKHNAVLIAITPETPDNSLSTAEKNDLSFEVLTDKDNQLAKAMNLVYQLPENLQDLYKNFGIDLNLSQGNTEQELPIAATYVIDIDGEITYHFLEEDYKLRADPQDILNALS